MNNTKTINKKFRAVFAALIFLLTAASPVYATGAFLTGQSYHAGGFHVSGTDGTAKLFSYYNVKALGLTPHFVAYQTADGPTGNTIHILAVLANTGILWDDISSTEAKIEIVSTGKVSSSGGNIADGTPGQANILINGDLTIPNGVQTIKVTDTIGFDDGSTMELTAEFKLNVK